MKTMRGASEASPRPRTIGKLAKEAKVNVETIRFYERRGLLRQPKAPATGWRGYEDSAGWVIHYLKLARQLGFTLAAIRQGMGSLGGRKAFFASRQRAPH